MANSKLRWLRRGDRKRRAAAVAGRFGQRLDVAADPFPLLEKSRRCSTNGTPNDCTSVVCAACELPPSATARVNSRNALRSISAVRAMLPFSAESNCQSISKFSPGRSSRRSCRRIRMSAAQTAPRRPAPARCYLCVPSARCSRPPRPGIRCCPLRRRPNGREPSEQSQTG